MITTRYFNIIVLSNDAQRVRHQRKARTADVTLPRQVQPTGRTRENNKLKLANDFGEQNIKRRFEFNAERQPVEKL